jgi:DNA-binding NarL/FixJ family response regulator
VEVADGGFEGALIAFLSAQPDLEIVSGGDADVVVAVGPTQFDRPTLVLGPDDPGAMIDAIEQGAIGYLASGSPLDDVGRAVRTVAEGQAVVPPLMLGALLGHVVRRRRSERSHLDRLQTLSSREREVFDLLSSGLDRSGIATRLFISVGTVRSHMQRLFRKLDVHSQAEIVAFAARCGLLTDADERGS